MNQLLKSKVEYCILATWVFDNYLTFLLRSSDFFRVPFSALPAVKLPRRNNKFLSNLNAG